MYYTNRRLEKVVRDAQALIEKSKASDKYEVDQDLAVPRLTGGGIITLERTLPKLRRLLESHPENNTS
jgi:ubiquitin-conjugating enzyme E2 O